MRMAYEHSVYRVVNSLFMILPGISQLGSKPTNLGIDGRDKQRRLY